MLHSATMSVADDSSMSSQLRLAIDSFDNTDGVLLHKGRKPISGAAMSTDPTWSADCLKLMMGDPRSTPSTGVREYMLIDRDQCDFYTSHWRFDRLPQRIVGGQFTALGRHPPLELTGEAGEASLTISPGGFFTLGSDWPREMLISIVGEARETAGVTIPSGGFFTLGSDMSLEMFISTANLVAWPSEEVEAFSRGFNYAEPSDDTVRVASLIVSAARSQALVAEFYVDDSDGAFGIMLRLRNGLLLLGELSIYGVLSAGTYNDDEGSQVEFIANATAEQIIGLF